MNRAQTVHDYLLGIVVVILTIGVAIGILGGAYDPFFDPVDHEDETLADNLADAVIEAETTMWGDRLVHLVGLEATLADDDAFDDLRHGAGLPEFKHAHVRVIDEDNEVVEVDGNELVGGDEATDDPAAIRVRSIHSVEDTCEEGCRLVVEVS